MHRRTIALVLALAVCLVSLPTVRAQPFPAAILYLPLVMSPAPPPPLDTLVVQPADMPRGFTVVETKTVSNEEAANTFGDPKKVLAIFAQQGRISSHYVRYQSDDYLLTGAWQVANQVFWYQTPGGALQGFDFAVSNDVAGGFETVDILPPALRHTALRREWKEQGLVLVGYTLYLQRDVYVTKIAAVGLRSGLSDVEAYDLFLMAASKLP